MTRPGVHVAALHQQQLTWPFTVPAWHWVHCAAASSQLLSTCPPCLQVANLLSPDPYGWHVQIHKAYDELLHQYRLNTQMRLPAFTGFLQNKLVRLLDIAKDLLADLGGSREGSPDGGNDG